jgi:Asp-tRNA(Asn)/Glu-tRNA(Gln) amidotransferase A subunit family amidase
VDVTGEAEANWLAATTAAEAMHRGALKPLDLVEACLERIAASDDRVRAWQLVDAGGARAAARGSTSPHGPLHGLPVGVKDIFDTAGLTTTYGSPIYAGHVPSRDAAVVARLRAAGALVLGKTVSTEFAMFHPGPTANPHALDHTPGGSSSGSAAAVAAGMVPLALGTQTAGSVIRPAAYCGVVGYKPTFGWVSRAGCLPVSETLDHVGGFARTVPDVALLASVLSGRDVRVDDRGVEPPSFGLYRPPEWASADPAVRHLLERVAQDVVAAGARVVELAPLDDHDAALEAHKVVLAYEGARELFHEWTAERDRLSETLRERLARGVEVRATDYDAALEVMRAGRAQAGERLAGVDALLTLSAPGPAPLGLASTGDPVCNRVWTLLGVPCVHLPVDRTTGGLPVGVQLVSAAGTDRGLFQVAAWTARALGVEHALRPAL